MPLLLLIFSYFRVSIPEILSVSRRGSVNNIYYLFDIFLTDPWSEGPWSLIRWSCFSKRNRGLGTKTRKISGSCCYNSVCCHLCPLFAAFQKILFCFTLVWHTEVTSFIFGWYWMSTLRICWDLSEMWLCDFLKQSPFQFHSFRYFLDVHKGNLFIPRKPIFIGLRIRWGLHHKRVILILGQLFERELT